MPRHNPLNNRQMSKLRESIKWSRDRLAPFRRTNKELIEQYAGGSYGEGGSPAPLNMIELAVNIYQRQLVSQSPSVIITSPVAALRPASAELELATNHLIQKQIDLGQALNEVVVDAMFTIGIMKVGETEAEHANMMGFRHDGSQPYADALSFVDWVHDANATRYEQVDYAGHRFAAPLDMVLDSPIYDKKAKIALESYAREGEAVRNDLDDIPAQYGTVNSGVSSEFRQKLWLWEIWLPGDDIIVTYADGLDAKPLWVRENTGKETGPFKILGYSSVPSSIVPLAPAMIWEDMGDLINRLMIKVGQQADRQKTVLAAQNRAANAVEAIMNTPDGHTVLTDMDPALIREMRTGGVDPNLLTTLLQFKQLFSYAAGNLDSLGGLGSQSQTLGQDKLLSQSASERLASMQSRTVKFTKEVVEDLAWYMWHNDTVDIPIQKKLTRTITRDVRWTSASRRGSIFDYNFEVSPHSLNEQSPQERMNVIMQIVSQVVMPMMPALQEAGASFDIIRFLELIAKLSNVDELSELIRNEEGRQLNEPRQGSSSSKPSVTDRTYRRVGEPSQTPEQKVEQQLSNPMANMQSQGQQSQGQYPGQTA